MGFVGGNAKQWGVGCCWASWNEPAWCCVRGQGGRRKAECKERGAPSRGTYIQYVTLCST